MTKLTRIWNELVAPFFRRPRRLQVAALCCRNGETGCEILLITSRGTGRWVIPKGWPMRGRGSAGAALQEAWEEAGVRGRISDTAVGSYVYDKFQKSGLPVPVEVMVYPVEVEELADDYPEAGQRRRLWVSAGEAATLVAEPGLQRILRGLQAEPANQGRGRSSIETPGGPV